MIDEVDVKILERLAAYSTVTERGCYEWNGWRDRKGYGQISVAGRNQRVHRLAWIAHYGEPPTDKPCVLHKCDVPNCWNEAHLFAGTNADNVADKCSKGREARGATHGSRTHPESLARGDRNGSRLHPESRPRGDSHNSRTHPERLSRGDQNGSRLHPESRPRGEKHPHAKLTLAQVHAIRADQRSHRAIADEYGVKPTAIWNIKRGKAWK